MPINKFSPVTTVSGADQIPIGSTANGDDRRVSVNEFVISIGGLLPSGLPDGGTTGQVLAKNSATDGDASWGNAGAGTVTNANPLALNGIVVGNAGAGVRVLGDLGDVGMVLHGNAAGAPTFGKVLLPGDVLGVLPVANGGTGTATPGLQQGTNITITGAWPNQTINGPAGGSGSVTSVTITKPAAGINITNSGVSQTTTATAIVSLANDLLAVENLSGTGIARRTGTDAWSVGTQVNLTSEVSNVLPVANGGSGTATPSLVNGTGVSITGTWPNQTITATSGSGTVTNSGGALTSNGVLLGAGGVDSKVAPGIKTDGANQLQLGVAGSGVGSVLLANATSGTIQIVPQTGALGTTVLSVPAGTGTMATTALNLGQFAPTTSAQLLSVMVDETGTGALVFGTSPTIDTLSTTGFLTQPGASVLTPTPMGALAINVGRSNNTQSIAVDSTFTFSGTPATGTQTAILVRNTDTNPHTATFPTSWSFALGALTTPVFTVPASGIIKVGFEWDGTEWICYSTGSSSNLVYKGTWASRPTTGLTSGNKAYMTDWPRSDFVWNGTAWRPTGPLYIGGFLTDQTFTESGSGAAQTQVPGAAYKIPQGLVQAGDKIRSEWNVVGALNTANKTIRCGMAASASTITTVATCGGGNHSNASLNGLSAYGNLVARSLTSVLQDNSGTDSIAQSTLTDITVDFAGTDYWMIVTYQLAAAAASMTIKDVRFYLLPGA